MIIGIVGSEKAKFTEFGELSARLHIRQLIETYGATGVCSGDCHLGGIDVWAEEIAIKMGLETFIFPPRYLTWTYYKERNIKIAEKSDLVYCLSVDRLPADFKGVRFGRCYHCAGLFEPDHVKSGGCWTTKYARKLGKSGKLLVIYNEDPHGHTASSALFEKPETSGTGEDV